MERVRAANVKEEETVHHDRRQQVKQRGARRARQCNLQGDHAVGGQPGDVRPAARETRDPGAETGRARGSADEPWRRPLQPRHQRLQERRQCETSASEDRAEQQTQRGRHRQFPGSSASSAPVIRPSSSPSARAASPPGVAAAGGLLRRVAGDSRRQRGRRRAPARARGEPWRREVCLIGSSPSRPRAPRPDRCRCRRDGAARADLGAGREPRARDRAFEDVAQRPMESRRLRSRRAPRNSSPPRRTAVPGSSSARRASETARSTLSPSSGRSRC